MPSRATKREPAGCALGEGNDVLAKGLVGFLGLDPETPHKLDGFLGRQRIGKKELQQTLVAELKDR